MSCYCGVTQATALFDKQFVGAAHAQQHFLQKQQRTNPVPALGGIVIAARKELEKEWQILSDDPRGVAKLARINA